MDMRPPTPGARPTVALLVALTVTGCAALESVGGLGDEGADPLTLHVSAADTTDACPPMPTAGLAPSKTRRPLDMDSIRKLPPDVVDSLASENALPRTDGEVVILHRNDPVNRIPTVRLDSAGYPIRVVPLCRVTGR